jgi:RNA polymerase sigma-70 factor (ECF subfamily)
MPPAQAVPDQSPDDPPDDELVRRCQAGDSRAFDLLVTRYRTRVYSVAIHLVQNETEAWDCAQEAFIKAWRALPNFKGDSGFYTWLFRITHNVSYDWLRKRRNRVQDGEFDDSRTDHSVAAGAETAPKGVPAPDQAAKNAELSLRIQAAIDKLSPDHREVIVLREVEGLSYEEIAAKAGCTIGTVMSRLFYARKKLQDMLRDIKP